MSAGPVTIRLALSDDGQVVTLTIAKGSDEPLAHASLSAPQLRPLVTQLALVLQRMEGAIQPVESQAEGLVSLPLPTNNPPWRLAQMDDGRPVIAAELAPALWVSFSLSLDDGATLASLLADLVGSQRSRH